MVINKTTSFYGEDDVNNGRFFLKKTQIVRGERIVQTGAHQFLSENKASTCMHPRVASSESENENKTKPHI